MSRDGDARLLLSTVTNKDGRTDRPLIAERPVPIGTYELRFSIAGYFKARGVALAEPPFSRRRADPLFGHGTGKRITMCRW